jgi:beta-lactamase regulating signal transducer with metallopeptidase domain
MLDSSQVQIVLWVVGALVAVNLLAMALFVLFARLSESKLKEAIRNIIFELDKFADEMENSAKRSSAIRQVNEILGWRQIVIPVALIGWVIDTEVAAIRKMQQATSAPNLHEEEDNNIDQ